MADLTTPDPAEPAPDALPHWLRLANLPFSTKLVTALLDAFGGDSAAIFAASDRDLDAVPLFQARHLVTLRKPEFIATERQLAWFEKYGVRLILPSHPEYPQALCTILDTPPFLFVRGSLAEVKNSAVGIVGSRRATPYGRAVAERFGRELAARGVTVVSGGAVGIDSAAHRGVVTVGGRTVAVLGCGLDVDYPRDNRELFEKIVESGGALVSEYSLGAQPEAWRFPLRNRIISGISLGVLVVEAPQRSGALITAQYAAEHGRTLMTVPGNIDRPSSVGSNELLRLGAAPVLQTDDILEAVGLITLRARPDPQTALDLREPPARSPGAGAAGARPAEAPPAAPKVSFPALPEKQQKLLQILSQTPQHIDALAQQCGVTASEAGVEMTFLELDGLVRRLPGNTYIRTF
ncbi:MAG TPA: DNA-processing protein DprA [Chthonomonadaceae bacterium]|nr:DNA-processing protein DprA [Chthonomonadaceae bacterium]